MTPREIQMNVAAACQLHANGRARKAPATLVLSDDDFAQLAAYVAIERHGPLAGRVEMPYPLQYLGLTIFIESDPAR